MSDDTLNDYSKDDTWSDAGGRGTTAGLLAFWDTLVRELDATGEVAL